jgi:hypothetical protein
MDPVIEEWQMIQQHNKENIPNHYTENKRTIRAHSLKTRVD